MKATVRGLRGCERAEITIDRITLLAGDNGAGKSSIIESIGCCLTGTLSPILGMPKKDLKILMKHGAKTAHVDILSETGSKAIDYPQGEQSSMGSPPGASVFAVGLSSAIDLSEKDRVKLFTTYLKSEPTRDDFDVAMGDIGETDKKTLDNFWHYITSRGWDGAFTEGKEENTKLKGQWEGITDERYGSAKAANWFPSGWNLNWKGTDETELAVEIENLEEWLEKAIAKAAVGRADLERLTAIAAKLPELKTSLATARQNLAKAEKEEAAAKAELEANPSPAQNSGIPCPHCGCLVWLRNVSPGVQQIEEVKPIDAPELKRRRDAFAIADGRYSHAKDEFNIARRAVERIEGEHNAAEAAQKDVDAAGGDAASVGDAETVRLLLEEAKRRAAAVKAQKSAAGFHTRIERATKMLEVLGENGVRRTKLIRTIDAFNLKLKPLTEAANWKHIQITADMDALYDGIPYRLLSDSEQWRVRAVIHIAMAQIDQSALICLDGADILNVEWRNQLFGMLATIDIPVLVGMTLPARASAPNLAAAGLGVTYWVKDGVAVDLAKAA